MCSPNKINQKEQPLKTGWGWRVILGEIRASTLNVVGIFPWLLASCQLHHQRKIIIYIPRPQELSYKLPAVSQSTTSFQLLYPAFFYITKTKNKNVVTLLFWQDSEPGRLVGLPYIIGDLTYILPSIRLSHIEQSQHFCIGTIYPRVLEQT